MRTRRSSPAATRRGSSGWRDGAWVESRPRGLRLPHHAIAEVRDAGPEGARLDELEIDPSLALREERDPTADQHGIDPGPVLVDQVQRGDLRGEVGAADGDVALPGLGSQPRDLLRQGG